MHSYTSYLFFYLIFGGHCTGELFVHISSHIPTSGNGTSWRLQEKMQVNGSVRQKDRGNKGQRKAENQRHKQEKTTLN